MAFNKQRETYIIIVLLVTTYIVVPVIATTNVDCKGKAFHCVNSTHFKICVDFGGVSKTVDDFLIPCPPSTACTDSNYFECEYQIPTTSAPVAVQSDVTNEISETTILSPWELLDVTTFFPINNNERSMELSETSTITPSEKISKATGSATADKFNFIPMNDVINEVATESKNIIDKMKISDLSEGENINTEPTHFIVDSEITLTTITDETKGLSDNKFSSNIPSAAVTTENYPTTESAVSINLFNTIITTSSNTVDDANSTSTLFNTEIIDSFNRNNLSAEITTENYSGTKSAILTDLYKSTVKLFPDVENTDNTSTTLSSPVETDYFRLNSSLAEVITESDAVTENDISIFLLEPITTTRTNNIGNEGFIPTTLSSLDTDDSLKNSLTAKTTENYSGTDNDIFLTTSNKLNTHFTTTTLSSSMITKTIDAENIQINLRVTSDSYLPSIQQDSIVRDSSVDAATATQSNEFDTSAVEKAFNNRVDNNIMYENSTHPIRIDEILPSSQNLNSVQMEFRSTTAEDVVKKNILEGSLINEQNELSLPALNTAIPNTKNIITLSDKVDSVYNTGSYLGNRHQVTTVTNFGQTTTQANVLYTKTPNNKENINLNKDDKSITKLYSASTEINSIPEKIVNSAPDFSLTVKTDSYVTNVQNDTADGDINSPTLTTRTEEDIYTTIAKNTPQVYASLRHENGSSILSKSDFLFTGYDEELHSTAVNEPLKNTVEKISTKEQSDTSQQINYTSHSIGDKFIKNILQNTTVQPISAIDLTINTNSYYDVNLSTEFDTNFVKKDNNTKVEFLRHDNGTYKNINDEITTPLPQNANLTLSAKTDNVEVSFITDINVSLNDKVEEMSIKENDLPSPMITGNVAVTEIIVTSKSDKSDLISITESYVVNTQQHLNVTKEEHLIPSTIDGTILPTTQNVVTETLTNDFYSNDSKGVYGHTQEFTIQQNDNDNNIHSVPTTSFFPSFPKHNDNLRKPSTSISEPKVTSILYEQTTKTDTDLSKTQASIQGTLSSTTASMESLISNTVNETDNYIYDSSQRNSEHPLNLSNSTSIFNTTGIPDKEQTTDLINENLTTTSVKKSWDTINDTVQDLITLITTSEVTIGSEITPTKFDNQPTTVNYVSDNIITTHSFIEDGMGVSSNITKENIAKVTLTNENQPMSIIVSVPKPSVVIKDSYIVDVIENTYSSTFAADTGIENYSYKKKLSENNTQISISELNNLKILPQIINSTVTGTKTSNIYKTAQNFKMDEKSFNVNVTNDLSLSTENVITRPSVTVAHSIKSTIGKDQYTIRPSYETNSNQLLPKTPIKNTLASTERTTPLKSQLNESYFPLDSSNTSLRVDYENTAKENAITLINVTKEDSDIATSKMDVPNVNSSTQSYKDTLKVTELERLVNNKDTNKIFTDDTTSAIVPPITENNLRLTPNIGYVEDASVNKNISRQYVLSANSKKDINTTVGELTTRESVMSGELNTSTSTNINDTFIPEVNTDANLYKHYVKNISLNIPDKKYRKTVDTVSKNIVTVNNLSIDLENLTTHDQNNSYFIYSNKTRKDDINRLDITVANKQSLNIPVLVNEDTRKEPITRITPFELNKIKLSNDYERTKSKFNCYGHHRNKYSDKNDCQSFYICIGRNEPVFGKCPNNTVFSEISKQCTKNLSHCIRNNQFQCTSAGRYIDIFSDKFYYICAKKVEGYIRFKLQCQKGYHLDKSKLKCILDSRNGSQSNEDSSRTDSEKSTVESKSKEDKDSKKQIKDFECKKEGKFGYPDDCRKYYQCTKSGKSEFRRKIKKCDSDEIFDNEKRKCVDDESYECKE